jgi:hypothetical protein
VCEEVLSGFEISSTIQRPTGDGSPVAGATAGETVCVYPLDFGSGVLNLSIYREADARAFYDATVGSMPSPASVDDLGTEAVYGQGPLPSGQDAIVVHAEGVTFVLYDQSATPFGLDAMHSLAEKVLDRLT